MKFPCSSIFSGQCISFGIFVIYMSIAPILGLMEDSITSAEIAKLKETYLPAEIANTNFTLDDAKRLLRKKCKKAGAQNARIYDEIEAATLELMQCTRNFANFTLLLGEIEAARPVGELDVVFQKYCDKRPLFEQCLLNFNSHLLPCLNAEERAQNAIMMRIVSALLGFICHKNGDPIAIFIAEEGPECIEMQKENIGNCMNATFAGYMPKNGQLNTMDELPELVLNSKQCIDLYDFEECVLGYLEQCNEITPANIIESMFKYVKNETKCDTTMSEMKAAKGGASRNERVVIFGLNLILMLSFASFFK